MTNTGSSSSDLPISQAVFPETGPENTDLFFTYQGQIHDQSVQQDSDSSSSSGHPPEIQAGLQQFQNQLISPSKSTNNLVNNNMMIPNQDLRAEASEDLDSDNLNHTVNINLDSSPSPSDPQINHNVNRLSTNQDYNIDQAGFKFQSFLQYLDQQSTLYRQAAAAWLRLLRVYKSSSGVRHCRDLNNISKNLQTLKKEVLDSIIDRDENDYGEKSEYKEFESCTEQQQQSQQGPPPTQIQNEKLLKSSDHEDLDRYDDNEIDNGNSVPEQLLQSQNQTCIKALDSNIVQFIDGQNPNHNENEVNITISAASVTVDQKDNLNVQQRLLNDELVGSGQSDDHNDIDIEDKVFDSDNDDNGNPSNDLNLDKFISRLPPPFTRDIMMGKSEEERQQDLAEIISKLERQAYTLGVLATECQERAGGGSGGGDSTTVKDHDKNVKDPESQQSKSKKNLNHNDKTNTSNSVTGTNARPSAARNHNVPNHNRSRTNSVDIDIPDPLDQSQLKSVTATPRSVTVNSGNVKDQEQNVVDLINRHDDCDNHSGCHSEQSFSSDDNAKLDNVTVRPKSMTNVNSAKNSIINAATQSQIESQSPVANSMTSQTESTPSPKGNQEKNSKKHDRNSTNHSDSLNTAAALRAKRDQTVKTLQWCRKARKNPFQVVPLIHEGEISFVREIVRNEIPENCIEVMVSRVLQSEIVEAQNKARALEEEEKRMEEKAKNRDSKTGGVSERLSSSQTRNRRSTSRGGKKSSKDKVDDNDEQPILDSDSIEPNMELSKSKSKFQYRSEESSTSRPRIRLSQILGPNQKPSSAPTTKIVFKTQNWFDFKTSYIRLDLDLGKEDYDSESRLIYMEGKSNYWKKIFRLPELGRRVIVNKFKRSRFSFELWRPRCFSFIMGHRPIGHLTRGIKLKPLLSTTSIQPSCLVTGEADDRNICMHFRVRLRLRRPMLYREFERVKVKESFLYIPAFPPSLM